MWQIRSSSFFWPAWRVELRRPPIARARMATIFNLPPGLGVRADRAGQMIETVKRAVCKWNGLVVERLCTRHTFKIGEWKEK